MAYDKEAMKKNGFHKAVFLTEEMHTKFKRYCKGNNLIMNHYLNTILEDYFKKIENK